MSVVDFLIQPWQLRWVRECIRFVCVVGSVFIVGLVVLYHQAFYIELTHYAQQWSGQQENGNSYALVDMMKGSAAAVHDDVGGLELDGVASILPAVQTMYDYHLATYLDSKVPTYTLAFNTTIPGNRVTIRSLDIDAPIVNVPYVSDVKLADADFDEELKGGVVRYPFTTLPGQQGNALIFGHSSVDGWEQRDNKYGFVFYKLPKILPGEEIDIVWEGKKYTYVVEEKIVTSPDKVGEEIAQHVGDKYLTLMACYPLFTDAKRILVRAKLKEEVVPYIARNEHEAVN